MICVIIAKIAQITAPRLILPVEMKGISIALAVFVVLSIVFASAFAFELVSLNSANSKAAGYQKTLNTVSQNYVNQQGAVVLKSSYDHWNYISDRDISSLMSQYTSNATLDWIGGPLNGTYSGTASIEGVWQKFFSGWSSIWFLSQGQPSVIVTGNVSSVSARIQFTASPAASPQQVNYLNISYTLHFIEHASEWHIYAEEWMIKGAGPLSYTQGQFSELNYLAVSSAAFSHWDAIAIENASLFSDQYASNATLHWIGGPLTGTYNGTAAINGVWNRFFGIWSAVWFYTVSPPAVGVSGNTATVTSMNQFVLTPSSNQSQVQYLTINYTLNFIENAGSWMIYNEIWHIVGSGFISLAQESAELNSVTSLAFTHWNNIAIENSTSVMQQYASNATLHWIGGKLSGTYNGTAAINGVWNRFFGIWSAVWFYSESPPVVTVNGQNALVKAVVQFVVQNASNTSQFFYLNVTYTIHYYSQGFSAVTGQIGYAIVAETFDLTGSGPLSRV